MIYVILMKMYKFYLVYRVESIESLHAKSIYNLKNTCLTRFHHKSCLPTDST